MKPYHHLALVQPEHPSLPGAADETLPIRLDRTDPHLFDRLAPFALPDVDIATRRQIADALTAILVQAEATRRNALRLPAGASDITSSSQHIIDCAKRVWQLIADQPDLDEVRSLKD